MNSTMTRSRHRINSALSSIRTPYSKENCKTGYVKEKESSFTTMEEYMKGSGAMTRGMDTVMNDFKTATYIKASSIKARLQVKAYLLGLMERYMTGNGSVVSKKGTASGAARKGIRI